MKIAVLLTGQLRDTNVNYRNHIKQFFEPNNMDVFIVTSTKNFIYTKKSNNPLEFKYSIHSENKKDDIESKIKERYGKYLKNYIIKDDEYIPDGFGTQKYFAYFMNNQLTNNKMAFKLALEYEKSNNIKYDLFVRLRIDKTVFPKPVLLDIKRQKFPIVTHNEPCTFFLIGNKEMMKHYCEYTFLKKIVKNYSYKGVHPECISVPHQIWKHMKTKFNINIIKNIITIYSHKGIICEYPYLNRSNEFICWNGEQYFKSIENAKEKEKIILEKYKHYKNN